VPVGLPPAAFPVTATVSVSLAPNTTLGLVGAVEVTEDTGLTPKHSSVVLSELEK
jgi:hypothetical protein